MCRPSNGGNMLDRAIFTFRSLVSTLLPWYRFVHVVCFHCCHTSTVVAYFDLPIVLVWSSGTCYAWHYSTYRSFSIERVHPLSLGSHVPAALKLRNQSFTNSRKVLGLHISFLAGGSCYLRRCNSTCSLVPWIHSFYDLICTLVRYRLIF